MKRGWGVGVPLVAALAGLLFSTSAATSHGVDLRVTGRDDLQSLAARAQDSVRHQVSQLSDLQAQVQAATSRAARSDVRVAQARDAATSVARSAGLTAVTGPGITVTLDDAPPLPGSDKQSVPPDYLVVHQQDVQAVVNALWAGGAEAMTLQGQRVISTSAVRCVGNTLLLQGIVYSPPYVVSAIGDPAQLLAALEVAPDVVIYREYVDAYELGYSVKTKAKITAPAYDAGVRLAYARPVSPTAPPASRPPRTPVAPIASASPSAQAQP